MNDQKYILDVPMCTYNHEKYIAKAIEGVLKQETNFNYRLIIGEDCSTDKTRDIVEKYLIANPTKMMVFYHEKNMGASQNSEILLRECTSKYIALCDGDDYWTDSSKLQKQVDFLEKHPDYSICCHDVLFQTNKKKYRSGRWDTPVDSDIQLLLRNGNYIVSLSVVMRNHQGLASFMKKFEGPPVGDYLMYLSAAQEGKIRFMKERMGVYRIHSGGMWSQQNITKGHLKSILLLTMLFDGLPEKYHPDLKIQVLTLLDLILRTKELQELSAHPDMQRLLQKCGIPEYVVEFLKLNVADRLKVSFYSNTIPYDILVKALKEKVLNRILRV